MAVFSLTIPDAEVDRVTAALCASGGYADVTVANATLAIISYLQSIVVTVETQAAAQAAVAAIAPVVPPTGIQ